MEAKVVLGNWIFRRHRLLTIELIADDRLALGRAICRLAAAEGAARPWSSDDMQKLFKKLMARNPKGYDGWHPGDVQLVPVSLSIAEWRMIMRICTQQSALAPDDWPPRVLAMIEGKAGGSSGS